MLIRFTPDAEAELAEARQWYAHQRKDLDGQFMECIDDALARIVRNPHLYPIVYRTLSRGCSAFPVRGVYEITGEEIHITAVFHSRRDPESWKSRVE